MKNKILICAAALLVAAAPPKIEHGANGNFRPPIVLQLDAVPTGALVTMLMRDVMRVPYVIAPDVLSDRRLTSISLRIPRDKVPERVVAYLRKVGFTVDLQGGTVYVGRAGSRFSGPSGNVTAMPLGSPVDLGRPEFPVAERAENVSRGADVGADRGGGSVVSGDIGAGVGAVDAGEPSALLGYVPAHRDTAYFSTIIGPLLPDVTFGARGAVQPSEPNVNIAAEAGPDVLLLSGTPADLARARQLIVMLDRPRPLVAVKAVVMQVSDIRARGSALSVLAELGRRDSGGGSFPGEATASQFVRIATGGFTAVLSAVREDSRVRVVASPNLSALSGAVATINAGAQVPTLGAVAVADGGTPVQSVVYRESGITLTVRPVVRGDLIELDVRQERSSFARTTTGIEDSPTLNKASASAQVVLKSGESIVLAGLTEQSDENRREGLFGGLLGVRSRDKADSELLVMLQAELVPLPVTRPGEFIEVEEPTDDERSDADPLAPA